MSSGHAAGLSVALLRASVAVVLLHYVVKRCGFV